MRPKKASLHPLLIILAVALVSVLFVAACGDDEAPAVSEGAGSAEAAAASAAASQAAKAAEAAAMAAEEAAAQAGELAAAAQAAEQAAGAEESEAVRAAQAAAAQAEAAAAQAEAAEAAATEFAKYGGSLTMAFVPDHSTLDPAFSTTAIEGFLIENVYDPLLRIVDRSYSPALAESWETNDDLSSYIFHLRQGVKFHHGKEFKAEDVIFSMNRIRDPEVQSPNRSLLEAVDNIVAIDDYTVRFDLNGPNGFFLDIFTVYQFFILPADVDLDRLTLEAFGTGPFILDEWLAGERATMVRNPDYWEEGRPYLDEIVLVGIAEPVSRAAALKNGDVDMVYNLETQSVADIEAHPETKVVSEASTGHIGINMDNSQPPFDNKLVRQAFQAATDRELINQAALLGLGSIAYDHSIASSDPRFAPQYAPEYDPELAKSLLEQAGYPDGIDITLHTGDVAPGMIEMAVAFQQSAAPAGIRVEVQKQPSDAFWTEVFMQEPFVVVSWGARPNVDVLLTYIFQSDSAYNANRYSNDTIDELIERGRGETLEQQKETYGEIQRILVDDVPGIIVANQPVIYGARNNVQDAGPHGGASRNRTMRNAWLAK